RALMLAGLGLPSINGSDAEEARRSANAQSAGDRALAMERLLALRRESARLQDDVRRAEKAVRAMHKLYAVIRTLVTEPHAGHPPNTEGLDLRRYDIVIVGGGAAGCALASALGTSGTLGNLRVALVDPSKLSDTRQWQPPTDTFLPRTLQITASNKRYFEQRGVWGECFTDRIQACNRAVVTDAIGRGMLDLDASDPTSISPVFSTSADVNDSVAFMIETKNLVSGLLRSIHQSRMQIDVFERTKVVKIDSGSESVRWPVVTLSNNTTLQARLLVGADGGSSQVRKFGGIDTYGTEYGQYGLAATLCLDQLNTTAFQRFLPTGPVAILPFPGGFANLIWSTGPEQLQLLKSVSTELFSTLVNAAFRLTPAEIEYFYDLVRSGTADNAIVKEILWRLDVHAKSYNFGAISKLTLPPRVAATMPKSRLSFPLRMRIVDSLVSDRVALVGDSGHVMHPLAGQGLNMGLEDVKCLVETLEQAVLSGQDIGISAVLEKYNKQRYVRNLAMQGVVDKVWNVFGTDAGSIARMRSLAMNSLDSFSAAKKLLLKTMMT
ncbi:putative ubiquinone biosynthesis monooxygenase, partial [Coemansia sp. RSA 2607]